MTFIKTQVRDDLVSSLERFSAMKEIIDRMDKEKVDVIQVGLESRGDKWNKRKPTIPK